MARLSDRLCAAGFDVVATDIVDYGGDSITPGVDYLTAPLPHGVLGIVTNPPYRRAVEFAPKALGEVPYLALLLRTNFLESTARLPFFRKHPPARVWVSSRRLPMMHRHGWAGPQAPRIPASRGSSGTRARRPRASSAGSTGEPFPQSPPE